jgi:hypothetical protein
MLINEIIKKSISDKWFHENYFTCFKKSVPEPFHIATHDGEIDTLEGPVKYKKGYYIITGPKGEQYPIPPEKFHELKDDNGDGTATPKKIIKVAKVADHSGTVDTSWGQKLYYNPGDDIIVRHGKNDYGVVKKEIFDKTYTIIDEDDE